MPRMNKKTRPTRFSKPSRSCGWYG